MKILLSLLLLSTISACASQKVYLFSRYLNPSDTLKVQKDLEAKGYDVEANEHYFPYNINSNTLVHSFYFNQFELEKLVVSLANLGFSPVDKQFYAISGKHSFTKNSVGIYLYPDEIVTNEKQLNIDANSIYEQNIVGDFESPWDCASSYSLELRSDKTFTQEERPWEESNDINIKINIFSGTWELSNNKVTLSFDNETERKFEVSLKKSIDGGYMRHSTILTPTNRLDSGLSTCELKMDLMEYINI